MKQHKYMISDYWKAKINRIENFWGGLFESQPLTPTSVIINPVILNSYSNQHEDAWVVYPNPQSVIGFLKFLYLPTALMGLLKEDSGHYYFEENLNGYFESVKEDHPDQKRLISKIEEFYNDLNDCMDEDDPTSLNNLMEWANRFNEDWVKETGIILSTNIFNSPKETIHYIIESYEEDLGLDFLEEDFGLTKTELLEMTSIDIYKNDFLKRKFTDILTNRLNVTF